MEDTKVVVIGGGTGSFTLLKSLKNHFKNITALVSMADDGGSTGILRDELGVLPPGDVRQCLVALSNDPQIRDLFNYRFEEGTFAGHAFGNLFITATEKVTGSFTKGVELASSVLNITGAVEPVLTNDVTLCLKTKDGKTYKGQSEIENTDFSIYKPELWLDPKPVANPKAINAIDQAEVIIVAPGNLYASLAPALLVPELGEAIKNANAKRMFICNLVTKPGQTDGFNVSNFADEIERFIGYPCLDFVVYNTAEPSKELLKKYASQGEYGVAIDHDKLKSSHYTAIGEELLGEIASTQKTDLLKRTLIRHDSDRLASVIHRIIEHEK